MNTLSDFAQNLDISNLDVMNRLIDINVKGYDLMDPARIDLRESDALANSVLLWLLSERGDYFTDETDITLGGPLYPFIGKPLTQESADSLVSEFQVVFTQMFENRMFINRLIIQVDPLKKVWKLDLEVTNDQGTSAEIQVEVAP